MSPLEMFQRYQRLQRGTEYLEPGTLSPEQKLWGQKELAGIYDPGPGGLPPAEQKMLTEYMRKASELEAEQAKGVYKTIGINIDGQEVTVPLWNPDMTDEEAEEAARMRLEWNLDPFATDEELEAVQNAAHQGPDDASAMYAMGTSSVNPGLKLFHSKQLRKKKL